jgi:cytochrome P450
MAGVYLDIIKARRESLDHEKSEDMIWNLMRCVYKDGTPLTDKEIAHLMIALLMAGQASSAVTSSWIMLELAAHPSIAEELYEEQHRVLGTTNRPLDLDNVQKLTLHAHVVRETLRLHPPVNALMRKVKRPLHIPGTGLYIPESNILLAAIGHVSRSHVHFEEPNRWNPHRWYSRSDLDEDKHSVKVDYGYGLVSAGATSPFLPFGAGRHRCIGEQFTYLQLVTVVALMVKEFEFSNLKGQKGVVATDWSVSTPLQFNPHWRKFLSPQRSMVARPLPSAKIQWTRRRRTVS